VLAGNGFQVLLTPGPTPTPVISYSVQVNHAIAALNITASHNPPEDCGFKVRDEQGRRHRRRTACKQIEALHPAGGRRGRHQASALADGAGERAGGLLRPQARVSGAPGAPDRRDADQDAGLKIVVDNMWGNGAGWLSEILGGGSTEVIEVHAERNPIFPEMSPPRTDPAQCGCGAGRGQTRRRRLRLHHGWRRRPLRLWR
jgi:phosphomannomutase